MLPVILPLGVTLEHSIFNFLRRCHLANNVAIQHRLVERISQVAAAKPPASQQVAPCANLLPANLLGNIF